MLPRYERLYRTPYPDPRVADPIRARVATLRAAHVIADRRARPLAPPPAPEQLALAL